jgi:hypothetical protein
MTKATPENKSLKEYAERDNRVNEAIAMKMPNRVPIQLFAGYFAGKYCGIPFSSAYYDPEKWRAANIRTITGLEPDVYWAQTADVCGKALEILGPLPKTAVLKGFSWLSTEDRTGSCLCRN